jgi:hypothetical protein
MTLWWRALLVTGPALLLTVSAAAISTGPPPGSSGVPAGGGAGAELGCAAAGCHDSFSLNPDATGQVVLTGVPDFYDAGKRYPLTLRVSHPDATRWGFQLTSVAATGLAGAGDFNPVDRSTSRVDGGASQRRYIGHGAIGRGATGIGERQSYEWRFEWIAPAADAGDVWFFGLANAANGDGSSQGDRIYGPPEGQPLAESKSRRGR